MLASDVRYAKTSAIDLDAERMSTKSGYENGWKPSVPFCCKASTVICSGCDIGRGRSNRPLMTLNTVVLTAMPRPSVTIAIRANPGALRSERIAYFMSCQKLCIISLTWPNSADGIIASGYPWVTALDSTKSREIIALAGTPAVTRLKAARFWELLSVFGESTNETRMSVILFLQRLKEYHPGGLRGWVCLSTARILGRLHGSAKSNIEKRRRTRRSPPEICHPRHRARAGLRRPDAARILHLQDADRDDFADR